MENQNADAFSHRADRKGILWITLGLLAILIALFFPIFQPNQVLFFNDAPLGLRSADFRSLPEGFTGVWNDLTWVGKWAGSKPPNITHAVTMVMSPVAFTKFYTPLTILVLGISAWLFFRQLNFPHPVCAFGGLMAALNTEFFSYAAWGLGSHTLAIALTFLAFAALTSPRIRNPWAQTCLAGLAVGLAVMEAYDTGAILSLYVALFLAFHAWQSGSTVGARLTFGGKRLAIVVIFSMLVSLQTLMSLMSTQIQGIAGMDQTQKSEQERWDWATQWSLPKAETFRVFVSGLYGYRMDTPDGGQYWGSVGRTPGWEDHGQGMPRYTGSDLYAGVLVLILMVWGVGHAFRRQGNPFSAHEKRWIGFWVVIMLVSLFLAYGRHSFLYQFFYSLPYASTIRNPIKFLHPFSIALVILATYGMAGLYRRYLQPTEAPSQSLPPYLKRWWARAEPPEKRWVIGYLVTFLVALLAWLIYASMWSELTQYIQANGFNADQAKGIARFSIGQMGWFLLFLALSLLAMAWVTTGYFAGHRAKWGVFLLILIGVIDLARANSPWIQHYNYKEKYQSNAVIDRLKQEPFKHRVQALPLQTIQRLTAIPRKERAHYLSLQQLLTQIHQTQWLQHLFPYYNIQSLDVVQQPRISQENMAYRQMFPPSRPQSQLRLWELTNTRYLIAPAETFPDTLNQHLAPDTNTFESTLRFGFYREKESGTIRLRPHQGGRFALLEYNDALPRAKLYENWQVITNDQEALKRIGNDSFKPHQSVVVDRPPNLPSPPSNTDSTPDAPGTIEFKTYAAKQLTFEATVNRPAVMLLNDKYNPHWTVTVDGKPAELLQCNFLMRGVALEPGSHTIRFQFQPPHNALYISLLSIAAGIALLGYTLVIDRHSSTNAFANRGC